MGESIRLPQLKASSTFPHTWSSGVVVRVVESVQTWARRKMINKFFRYQTQVSFMRTIVCQSEEMTHKLYVQGNIVQSYIRQLCRSVKGSLLEVWAVLRTVENISVIRQLLIGL